MKPSDRNPQTTDKKPSGKRPLRPLKKRISSKPEERQERAKQTNQARPPRPAKPLYEEERLDDFFEEEDALEARPKRQNEKSHMPHKPRSSYEKSDSKPRSSYEKSDSKPRSSYEKSDSKPRSSYEKSDSKKPWSKTSERSDSKKPWSKTSERSDSKPRGSYEKSDSKPRGSYEKSDSKPRGSYEKSDSKPRGSYEKSDSKPRDSHEKSDSKRPWSKTSEKSGSKPRGFYEKSSPKRPWSKPSSRPKEEDDFEPPVPRMKRQEGAEYLYGILPVEQALVHRKRRLEVLYVKEGEADSKRLRIIEDLALQQGIPIERIAKTQLYDLCPGVPHQGVVLRCGELPWAALSQLPDPVSEKPQILLALDQVEDPHNVGAIIRSASFFGVAGVIMAEAHSPGLTAAVSKASAGTLESFPVYAVTNLVRFLKEQKEKQYWVVGMEESAKEGMIDLKLDRSLIVVMGNEGQGLRHLVRETCDWLVQIPGNPKVGSLNVSNAAAIALYQLRASVRS